ncbi:MAG: CARDB domain-containing protein [Chitinophagaceae bacterium]
MLGLLSAAVLGLCLQADPASAADPLIAQTVTTGQAHTCAIQNSGQAVCWGNNYQGQLGTGNAADRLVPTPVQGITDAIAISAGGHHTCAIRTSGQAYCWGSNSSGQIGDGTTNYYDENFNEVVNDRHVPTPVQGLSDAIAISAGYDYTCAIRTSGQAVCWGSNDYGQIGDGTYSHYDDVAQQFLDNDRLVPTPVVGLADAKTISSGGVEDVHTCAIRNSGQAVCWGSNRNGEIGDGTHTYWDQNDVKVDNDRLTPTAVQGLADAESISAGGDHSCAVRTSGQAVCWGGNQYGQLGDGTVVDHLLPTAIPGLGDTKSIIDGSPYVGEYTCAVRDSGQVLCWGWNWAGGPDLPGPASYAPVAIAGLTDADSFAASWYHSCAIRTSGEVACWGANHAGQIGDGTTVDRVDPTTVFLVPSIPVHSLTVNKSGSGTGVVTSSPGGISCGLDCVEAYDEGSQVTMTATPTSGSTFTGWSGAGCSGTGTCQVTIGSDQTATATFAANPPTQHTLTAAKAGTGQGTITSSPAGIDCGATCSHTFDDATQVTLTAAPTSGSTFTGWSGAGCSGTGTCQVTINSDQTATATFAADTVLPGEATISKVTISGPAKVKKGKQATYAVKITNSGNATATGVRLKVSGRGVSFNTSLGTIPASTTRTVNIKLKPKTPGKIKASFKVTSENAGSRTATETITVKR